MRSSIALFNALASDYDEHFRVPYRRAYDVLAWRFVEPLLPIAPGKIIDAGCGVGRWAERLIDLGHHVIGIEQAPAMAAAARARLPIPEFELIEEPMEQVELPEGQADLTLALGSLQYSVNPERMLARLARWTRPGGVVFVLVDSLLALVLELAASEKVDQALQCLRTKRGTWVQGNECADNHQFDRDRLIAAFQQAGLIGIQARGLLVGASLFGRSAVVERLLQGWDRQMLLEYELAEKSLLADLGKQLFVSGSVPRPDALR